jgi:hypothetical protein
MTVFRHVPASTAHYNTDQHYDFQEISKLQIKHKFRIAWPSDLAKEATYMYGACWFYECVEARVYGTFLSG